jgi:phosphoglycolate phosphatase-like HAD superfamily hydrolase
MRTALRHSPKRRSICAGLAALPLARSVSVIALTSADAKDPLPSWNDTPPKQAILDFVRRTTDPRSADFTAPVDRIATFDNDGTLWVEKPLPNEVYFTLARVKELAARDPSLAERQPFRAALAGDAAYFQQAGAKAIVELFVATHTGSSQEDFAVQVREFLARGAHPKLRRPFTSLAYRPMLELLGWLRANGFQTWICSGGDADFMRVFAHQVYGIPSQCVIGSEVKREARRDGGRLLVWRLPALDAINDKDGKPVGIDRQIGKRPLIAGGNVLSGGDIAMMEYSRGRKGPSLQLLIDHDDEQREFAYAEKDGASLNAAREHGFNVVSIRKDWRTIFETTGDPVSDGRVGLALQRAASSNQIPA